MKILDSLQDGKNNIFNIVFLMARKSSYPTFAQELVTINVLSRSGVVLRPRRAKEKLGRIITVVEILRSNILILNRISLKTMIEVDPLPLNSGNSQTNEIGKLRCAIAGNKQSVYST